MGLFERMTQEDHCPQKIDIKMYPPRPTVLLQVSLLFLLLGVSYGRKCHFLKELIATQNMEVNLNSSNISLTNAAQDAIRLRSLSPWNYRLDVDENRYPRVIGEAICSHAWCLDSEGNQDLSKNSVPITQNMLVLHRDATKCHFHLKYQLVTVGCTCSKPNIRRKSGASVPTITT